MVESICKLCLEKSDSTINICSKEGVRLQIASILYTHFRCCFEDEPNEGFICKKCWWKVEIFHEFYLQIEAIHCTIHEQESIFVGSINDHLQVNFVTKEEPESDGDGYGDVKSECPNDFSTAEYLRERFDSRSPELPEVMTKNEPLTLVSVKPEIKIKKGKISIPAEYKELPSAKKPRRKRSRKKNKSEIYQCDKCELTFLTEFKLYCHIKEDHMALPFKCTQAKCVESYDTQEKLDEHLKQNHTRAECPHCHKMMKLYYLPIHIKLYHDKDQRIVCDLCGHVSNNINIHKSHHRLVHDIQPKLQCDICKDWSRNKNSLREHMRIRHIQKPQTCGICGKVSANKKALMKHKKFHFIEEREKFKCIACGRGFRDSTKLREHSYIHSGISDVYRCNHCDKSFRFASSMYAHRKKAHPMEEQYRLSVLNANKS